MNKVLHVLVYVFLVLAAAALYFELQLNEKRALIGDRNRLQEDFLVKIAKTIEKADPAKDASFEIKKDNSPVEAKIVDSPDMENVLDEYQASLEQANLETYNWDDMNVRSQLRQVYVTEDGTPDGKPIMDGSEPLKHGSPEDKLLNQLFESAKTQQSRLNTTRAALTDLRGKLEAAVKEINEIKPKAREDKLAFEEQKSKLTKLEEEKTAAENQVTKIKGQIDELNSEISSLKDEVSTAKDETEAKREELEKVKKVNEQLQQLLKNSIQTQSSASSGSGTAVASLPAGNKGKVITADNENMFAIVEFSDAAMKELKGDDLSKPLPAIDLAVKRPGFNGAAGEFVGRIRLRQEIKGKKYVVCDILGAWEQEKLAANDVVFAD